MCLTLSLPYHSSDLNSILSSLLTLSSTPRNAVKYYFPREILLLFQVEGNPSFILGVSSLLSLTDEVLGVSQVLRDKLKHLHLRNTCSASFSSPVWMRHSGISSCLCLFRYYCKYSCICVR